MLKLGIVGLGARSGGLLSSLFKLKDEVEITAVCDKRPEAVERYLCRFDKEKISRPKVCRDHRELALLPEVEAVLIPTSWNSHLGIARDVMRAGKYAGFEVGGASSIEELWGLIHAANEFDGQCMMLENCCYGRNELMALRLEREGYFGEIITCGCGYEHDLAWKMVEETQSGFERGMHNLRRCTDLYPTHGLGPISKILRINRGNRFLSIVSVASKARGFDLAAKKDGFSDLHFNEADVVSSIIKCANGETIELHHCISLPRPYSRCCRVQGTKGIWLEEARGMYIEGISPNPIAPDENGNPTRYTTPEWTPLTELYARFEHPLWQGYDPSGVGHGGMDLPVLRAFVDAAGQRIVPPIDVYDCAAWMSVTALAEQSVALGGMPVAFPDFTNGRWINSDRRCFSRWQLEEIEKN